MGTTITQIDYESKPAPTFRQAPPALEPAPDNRVLLRELTWLALPLLAEMGLHMVVGLTDQYVANHLILGAASLAEPERTSAFTTMAAAAAAVGTIQYILWFIGMIVGAIGVGSTAIISRALGARHRSLANSVCGQSVTAAVALGLVVGVILWVCASPLAHLTQLRGQAHQFALVYVRLLSWSLPFSMLMYIAGSCLRGAGDTITPAISMIIVDILNVLFTTSLAYGWLGLPKMGFEGIALGTVIAYIAGGLIQFGVLVRGRGGIRLHLHRLRPHWLTLKRLFRIGIPSGAESFLSWAANFAVVIVINQIDATNAMPAAHMNAIRIESISFMAGFAFATAAATMVGKSLGMNAPRRARRSAYLAYAMGGGVMTTMGIVFIFLGKYPAQWLSADAHIAELTARCLFITGFIQCSFAAAAVFGGALRGAGDTLAVMKRSLTSVLTVRLVGVLVVGLWMKGGLGAIWVVLASELFCRGVLIYLRFAGGAWRHTRV